MKQFYTKFVSLVFESREHGANDLFTCICKLITIHQYISKCPNYAAVNKRDLAFSFVNVDFILTSFAISKIPFIRHSLRETKLTDRQDAEYVNKTHFGEDCGALDVAPDVMSVNVCTRKSYTFYSVLETPRSKLLTGEKWNTCNYSWCDQHFVPVYLFIWVFRSLQLPLDVTFI